MKKMVILGIIFVVIVVTVATYLIDWGLTPPKWILGVWKGEYKHEFSGKMITETWIFKKNQVSSISTNAGEMEYKRQLFIDYRDRSTDDEYTIIIYNAHDKEPYYLTFKKISDKELKLKGQNLRLYRVK